MKNDETPLKEGDAKQPLKKDKDNLKTEPPISEKDEVKKAEEKAIKSPPKKL
jgi:hypothetical protein